MTLKDIGNKIDAGLSGFVHAIEGIAAWWRATFPKWFRFIFFYATAVVWVPVLIVLAIPVLIIGLIIQSVAEAYRDF